MSTITLLLALLIGLSTISAFALAIRASFRAMNAVMHDRHKLAITSAYCSLGLSAIIIVGLSILTVFRSHFTWLQFLLEVAESVMGVFLTVSVFVGLHFRRRQASK